jgi:putative endonuclease
MPSEALAKEGRPMHYVYLLESVSALGQRYIGVTSDLKRRLADHNAGKSPHTSKYAPWKLVTYVAFTDRQKAEAFEHYLKSGSGHAFAKKRL